MGGRGCCVLKYSPGEAGGGGAGPAGWAGPMGRGLMGWGGASAALAGAHDHVGQLLHLGLAAHVVHDGQGLQRLRHAARRRRRARVVLVVQGQDLRGGCAWSGSGVARRMLPPCQPLPISLCRISLRVFLVLCLSPCSTLGLYLTVLPSSEFSTLLPFSLSIFFFLLPSPHVFPRPSYPSPQAKSL